MWECICRCLVATFQVYATCLTYIAVIHIQSQENTLNIPFLLRPAHVYNNGCGECKVWGPACPLPRLGRRISSEILKIEVCNYARQKVRPHRVAIVKTLAKQKIIYYYIKMFWNKMEWNGFEPSTHEHWLEHSRLNCSTLDSSTTKAGS